MPYSADQYYRKLFSHPTLVRALFDGILPAEVAQAVDVNALRPLPTQLVSGRGRDRRADLAWVVPRRDGTELVILLMLEHQSRSDHYMGLRLMSYCALLYEDILAQRVKPSAHHASAEVSCTGRMFTDRPRTGHSPSQRPTRRNRAKTLPVVLPVVLYTGTRGWRAPLSVSGLLDDPPAGLLPYQRQMRYLVLDTCAMVQQSALPANNLATLLFQLEHNQGIEQTAQLLHTLMQQLNDPIHDELSRAIALYVRYALWPRALPSHALPTLLDTESVSLQEITAMTALLDHSRDWTLRFRLEGKEEGRREGRREGRAEGRQEGRIEGQALLLERLLTRRFGVLPETVRARLSHAAADQLEGWSLNVLDASTLDEVFVDVKGA